MKLKKDIRYGGGTTQTDRDTQPNEAEAKKLLCAMIRERLEHNYQLYPDSRFGGLTKEDINFIEENQVAYIDGSRWEYFSKNEIKKLGTQMFGRLRNRDVAASAQEEV